MVYQTKSLGDGSVFSVHPTQLLNNKIFKLSVKLIFLVTVFVSTMIVSSGIALSQTIQDKYYKAVLICFKKYQLLKYGQFHHLLNTHYASKTPDVTHDILFVDATTKATLKFDSNNH